jgi:hypothetical protein
MRPTTCFIAAAMALGLAGTATAQSPTYPPASTQPTTFGPTESFWTAAGFVGSGFGTKGDAAIIDDNAGNTLAYGGQFGYLWHGWVGPEFIADFSPTFDVANLNLFADNNSRVSTYMANVISALPLGANGQFLPYASGGFGGVALRADVIGINGGTFSRSHRSLGSNLGGGIMAFASRRVGFRGDFRHYNASTDDTLNLDNIDDELLLQRLASGLGFWRTTAGVSFRW